jgi:hypothetical protein
MLCWAGKGHGPRDQFCPGGGWTAYLVLLLPPAQEALLKFLLEDIVVGLHFPGACCKERSQAQLECS